MKKKHHESKGVSWKRMLTVFIAAALVLIFLSMRLAYIMLIKGSEYEAMAVEQWTNTVIIEGKRGRILDSNYNELAISGNVYRVDLDLNSIRNYIESYNSKNAEKISLEVIASQLGEVLEKETSAVLSKLESRLESGAYANSATLIRQIEKDKADAVSSLGINGVVVSSDTLRYYLNDNLLSHVIGVTDSDGEGLTGVDYIYNDILKGTPGVRMVEIDSYSRDLPYTVSKYTEPIDGKDVVLTIDENIQYIAEKAAERALENNKAKAVTIAIMNPNNGEVLAMVNKPDYNVNNPRAGAETYDELQEIWRNRAVSDTFEPGSIFKVITAISALEEGIIRDDTSFTCTGSYKVGETTINCWDRDGHGVQSFSDIIKNSCNPGFIQLGQMLGKERLQKYITLFGFGKSTGIDLPGEATGIIKSLDTITDTDLATIAFGQTNTVTTIQFMAAFNTIANGGTWITPHLLKEVVTTDDKGDLIVDSVYDKGEEKKIIREDTSELLRSYLQRVVKEGSGSKAYIEGHEIAGKTGTAQKVINGVYAEGKYISSFVGMTPANDPELTIMVTVDEPSGDSYYASQVSAPVAKEVLVELFDYLSLKSP